MRKTLLFAGVLLLTLTLPTVSAINPHYFNGTVTFTGDIEGEADLEVWDPSSKIVIEYELIDLTFQDREEREESDDNIVHDWNYFEGLRPEGWLYLRVFKNKGEATIKYKFGRITGGIGDGSPKYHLEGTGTWSDGTVDGPFTIYELTYQPKGKEKTKTTFDPCWTGSLTFNIGIVPA